MEYTDENFDIGEYMTEGVENIVKGILKSTLSNPKESMFMAKYAKASMKSNQIRRELDAKGEHTVPFLIASITSSCNLHCAGCYARVNDICDDEVPVDQLTGEEWGAIFKEAKDLGVGFILLAGGEPMLCRDVMLEAGKVPEILFPIFTNGTMIDEEYIKVFDKYRNLVPILSIEGHQQKTDDRRGTGVYGKLMKGMQLIQDNGLVFGASVTVTTENLEEVTSEDFIRDLEERGCKAVIFVEFVPVTEDTEYLAPDNAEREYMQKELMRLRNEHNMVFISFPGDEKTSGGCVAAGRGFFHINPHGGAEPCPFSPFSDINVKETSLKEAMNSKLFKALQEQDILIEDHKGGCTLFEKRDQVEAILQAGA